MTAFFLPRMNPIFLAISDATRGLFVYYDRKWVFNTETPILCLLVPWPSYSIRSVLLLQLFSVLCRCMGSSLIADNNTVQPRFFIHFVYSVCNAYFPPFLGLATVLRKSS